MIVHLAYGGIADERAEQRDEKPNRGAEDRGPVLPAGPRDATPCGMDTKVDGASINFPEGVSMVPLSTFGETFVKFRSQKRAQGGVRDVSGAKVPVEKKNRKVNKILPKG